jgi:ribonuclease HI
MMHIYTDGSCLDNPGPGGYAIVVIPNPKVHKVNHFVVEGGAAPNATNNRMEIAAVCAAMQHAINRQAEFYGMPIRIDRVFEVFIYTDSSYVFNGATKVRTEIPTANASSWARFRELLLEGEKWNILWKFQKVEAHSGNLWNDIADGYARSFALMQKLLEEKDGNPIKISLPGFREC